MSDVIDPRLAELFQLYADGELDAEHGEELNTALRNNHQARDAFVAFCLHSQILKEVLAEEVQLAKETSPAKPKMAMDSPRRQRWRAWGISITTAIVLLVVGWNWWSNNRVPDAGNGIQIGDHWKITATGNAQFVRVNPSLLRLDSGELFVESTPGMKTEPLRIETPIGAATATGTSFYIGTHRNQSNAENKMFKPITRVFVLSGIVTLATTLGQVQGREGELLAAEPNQQPVKLTVKANSDFAFDLYRQLADHQGNLFFSPYSISGALAMVAEGARGQTAKEMGSVLHFPKEFRRVGQEAQLIPWKTALIHTGYEKLNLRLHAAQTNPKYQSIKAKIDQLDPKYRALQNTIFAMENELLGATFGDPPKPKNKKPVTFQSIQKAQSELDKIGKQIADLEKQISLCDLRVANAIWADRTFDLNQHYVETIQQHYKTGGVVPVDFRGDFPAARRQINDWCAKQTNNRIKSIVPDMPPEQSRQLRLMLTNAIYFKADWRTKFEVTRTKKLDFTRSNGTTFKTETMIAPAQWDVRYSAFNADGSTFKTPEFAEPTQKTGLYPDQDGFSMVELAYRGNDVAMLIIAPNRHDGLPQIEKLLTADNLARWIKGMRQRDTTVYLPKFKQETSYDLRQTLSSMGMQHAFDSASADFTGIGQSQGEPFYLGRVDHKAFIEVNETGTEAAAVTSVGGFGGAPDLPRFIPEFRADRPFIYVIRDIESGSILFLGRIDSPKV